MPNINDFFAQYLKMNDPQKFITNLKNKELSKNPNATVDNLLSSFIVSYPIELLQSYHSWLLNNFEMHPKDAE